MSNLANNTKLDIDRIIFIGRTFEEYVNMFDLSIANLKNKKVLDCPAGACSFSATARENGLDVEACDIAYYFNNVELYNKGKEDIKHMINKMEKSKSNYNWTFFNDTDDLKDYRIEALDTCVKDMKLYQEKYHAVELPQLPFSDNEFDILLSAHFLFLYSEAFDFNFHIQTLEEMLRVTKEEIRIFPLVNIEGDRYEELDKIIHTLNERGYNTEEVQVNYEFQSNANSFLKINIK